MSNPLVRGADLPFQVEYIRTVDSSTHTRWQTRWLHITVFVQMIYPLLRGADWKIAKGNLDTGEIHPFLRRADIAVQIDLPT